MLRFVVIVVVACSAPPVSRPSQPPPAGSPFERFATMSPQVGELAPALALVDSAGARFDLAEAIARGPVVLVWGSFT